MTQKSATIRETPELQSRTIKQQVHSIVEEMQMCAENTTYDLRSADGKSHKRNAEKKAQRQSKKAHSDEATRYSKLISLITHEQDRRGEDSTEGRLDTVINRTDPDDSLPWSRLTVRQRLHCPTGPML